MTPQTRFFPLALEKGPAPALARLAVAVVGLWLAAETGTVRAAPQLDQPAPALVVTTLDGKTFDLGQMRGDVVLVNYWATWCAPCRKDMPKLNAFYRAHPDHLRMVGISVDRERDLAKVRRLAPALAYPVALLKDVKTDGFGPPEGVPLTFIIDTEGKVRDRMIDVRDELLDTLVVPLLPR